MRKHRFRLESESVRCTARITGRLRFAITVTLITTRTNVRRTAIGGRTTSLMAFSLVSGLGITAITGADSMDTATMAGATTDTATTAGATTGVEEMATYP